MARMPSHNLAADTSMSFGPGWIQKLSRQGRELDSQFDARFTQQCATGGQFLAGGFVHGAIHDVPSTGTWRQGAVVGVRHRVGHTHCNRVARRTISVVYQREISSEISWFTDQSRRHISRYADGKIMILDQSTGQAFNDWGKGCCRMELLSKCPTPRTVHMTMHLLGRT